MSLWSVYVLYMEEQVVTVLIHLGIFLSFLCIAALNYFFGQNTETLRYTVKKMNGLDQQLFNQTKLVNCMQLV